MVAGNGDLREGTATPSGGAWPLALNPQQVAFPADVTAQVWDMLELICVNGPEVNAGA